MTSAVSPYAALVEEHGLGASAQMIVEEVPAGARVLDIGCATGYVAELLRARGCSVVGFERDPACAAVAEAHCEQVIVGDFDDPGDRATIPSGFEAVVLGDVLEHLVDPWDALRFTRGLLAPGGIAIASIPNVAAWTVRLGLVRGAFDYADAGLLDRTHLRFFTRATAHELVRGAGFEIEKERFTPIEQPPGLLRRLAPRATDVAVKTALRAWPALMAQQFVLRLRPAGAAR